MKLCGCGCGNEVSKESNKFIYRKGKGGKKIIKICEFCGKEFEVILSLERYRFCSNSCKYSYRTGENHHNWKEKIFKNCEVCGKEFKVRPSLEHRRFCSNICKYSYRTGENNPGWNGGSSFEPYCNKFNQELKKKVRQRDNNICQNCGKTEKENGQQLSIHHIHYDKENCYPDLITVCCSCNSIANYHRNYWEKYYMVRLEKRGLLN